MTRKDHDRRNAEQVQLLLSELRVPSRTEQARVDQRALPVNRVHPGMTSSGGARNSHVIPVQVVCSRRQETQDSAER